MRYLLRLKSLLLILACGSQTLAQENTGYGTYPADSPLTLNFTRQSYEYFDDFSTDKAQKDSYLHSPILDSLPDIFLYGLLVYEFAWPYSDRALAFYDGFEVDSDAYLCYKFPLEEEADLAVGGIIEFDVISNRELPGHFSVSVSHDGHVWKELAPIESFGHCELALIPSDSSSQLYLCFSGAEIQMDNLHVSLTYDQRTEVAQPPAGEIPVFFDLLQNYPNPFNPTTTLRYHLPKTVRVELTIYDMLGARIRTLVDGVETAGRKQVTWDATNDARQRVPSGLYFCRFDAGEFVMTRKLTVMK